jgi:general secretion pathway protein K
MLVGLFLTLGARPDDVESYADRVIGWRTASSSNQDAEGSAYRMARVGYQPRGSNFPHSNELATVRDLPASLVERALPFVTVYSGLSQINVQDAAPEVIASLPGMTQDRLNAFLVQRQASPQNAKLLLPAGAQQYATLEGSKSYRVTIRITFDGGQTDNAEVVLLLFDEGDQPFAILSWRDRSTEFIADKRP